MKSSWLMTYLSHSLTSVSHPTSIKKCKNKFQKLLKKGIIQESESSYASPVVVVRMTDGSIYLCVDYRKLNLKTKKDALPLPHIDESFDALKGAR